MDKRTMLRLAVGCSLFAAGWIAGQIPADRTLVAPAQAQGTMPKPFDPDVLAALFGVASIAVDVDAATIRLNALTDRVMILERRLAQLETRGRR